MTYTILNHDSPDWSILLIPLTAKLFSLRPIQSLKELRWLIIPVQSNIYTYWYWDEKDQHPAYILPYHKGNKSWENYLEYIVCANASDRRKLI